MSGLPYPEKVRQEAVVRILDSHIPVVQVAREVGCSIDTMHRWVREHRQQGAASGRKQGAVPRGGKQTPAPTVEEEKSSDTSDTPAPKPPRPKKPVNGGGGRMKLPDNLPSRRLAPGCAVAVPTRVKSTADHAKHREATAVKRHASRRNKAVGRMRAATSPMR